MLPDDVPGFEFDHSISLMQTMIDQEVCENSVSDLNSFTYADLTL